MTTSPSSESAARYGESESATRSRQTARTHPTMACSGNAADESAGWPQVTNDKIVCANT